MSKAKNGSASTKKAGKAFANDAFATSKQFESAFKAGAEKASSAFYKNFDEMTSQGKDTLDAVVEATSRLTQGAEEINRALLGWTQQSLEQGVGTCKDLLDCKSLQDVIDLQATYAKSFFEGMFAEGTRLSEMSVRVANEAFEPVKERVNATMERMMKTAA